MTKGTYDLHEFLHKGGGATYKRLVVAYQRFSYKL